MHFFLRYITSAAVTDITANNRAHIDVLKAVKISLDKYNNPDSAE